MFILPPSHPRKLLLINSRFLPVIGGGETYVLELISHFSEKGWEVHVATSAATTLLKTSLPAVTVHYINGFDDGCQQFEKCLPAIRTLLDELRPDVVHVHNILPYFAYSCVVAKNEFPTVLTIHNTPSIPKRVFGTYRDYKTEVAFTQQLLTNGKCQKILVGSQYYLRSYTAIVPQIAKRHFAAVAHYFPPSITTGEQDTTNERQIPSDDTIILFPSRLIRRKGIEDALHAIAKLPTQYKLSIPGYCAPESVDYRRSIDKLIQRLHIKDRLLLPKNRVTPHEMQQYYLEADVVLIPSHYEGFGIVAVEAMQHKRPVISTAVGGLGEIVKNGQNAIVIPPHNSDRIVQAVEHLNANTILRSLLVENATDTITSRFSRINHMKKIEKVYHDISRRRA